MHLLSLTRLIPVRNDKQEIYRYDEEPTLVSPRAVLRVRHEKAVDHTLVILTNGDTLLVEQTMEQIGHAFERSTAE